MESMCTDPDIVAANIKVHCIICSFVLNQPEIRLNLSSSCTLSSPANIIFLVNQIKSEKMVDTLCGFFITLIAANFQLIKKIKVLSI